MREKKYLGLIIGIAMSLMLSGCGSKFPDLTEDQYNQIVEYSVGLLMKYSNNGQEKLTYVNVYEEQKNREREARRAAQESGNKPDNNTTVAKQPEVIEPDEPDDFVDATEETSRDENFTGDDDQQLVADNDSTIGDTTEEDEGKEEKTSSGANDPGSITLSSDETQEIMSNIFLSYQGYSISSTYPESSKSYVVNADKGKKLLVLRFDLYNASNGDVKVNMLNMNLLFQIVLNGKNLGYSAVTFLPNDLSSYIGTIESRAHESLVVLTQVSEKDMGPVENISLIVTKNGVEQKVNLR